MNHCLVNRALTIICYLIMLTLTHVERGDENHWDFCFVPLITPDNRDLHTREYRNSRETFCFTRKIVKSSLDFLMLRFLSLSFF